MFFFFFFKDSQHAAGICLGTIQARTHVQLAHACQQSMLSVQHHLRLPCIMCTARPGTWVMNVLIMPPHWGLSALCQIITLQHVGFVKTMIPLLVFSCTKIGDVLENCVTLELKQHRYLWTGVSAMFLLGLSMTFTHALHHLLFALSPLPVRCF